MRSPFPIHLPVQFLTLTLMLASCSGVPWGEGFEQAVKPDEFLRDEPIPLGRALEVCPSSIIDMTKNWPDSFPADLCYPRSTLVDARAVSKDDVSEYLDRYLEMDSIFGVEEEQFFQTFWETTDSVEDVRQFYQAFFEQAGWDTRSATGADGMILLGITGNAHVLMHFEVSLTTAGLASVSEATESVDSADFSELIQINRSDAAAKTQYMFLYITDLYSTEELLGESETDKDSLIPLDSGLEPNESSDDNLPILDSTAAGETDDSELVGAVEQDRLENVAGDFLDSGVAGSGVDIGDINEAPDILKAYIRDFVALGIVQLESHDAQFEPRDNSQRMLFYPNNEITRRDYARWLFLANNLFYGDRPSQMLRKSEQSAAPVFQDVLPSDPDFGVIQGLAEAGLIASPLADPSASELFRPEAPLTRENLVAWKAPLDTQNALPDATVDNIEQSWGFRDAGLIDPAVLSAIWVDHQNGDASNIRRAFGYTRLFQPKKVVTRAEAAAVLWFFGTQSEGISAVTLLKDEDINDIAAPAND